MAQSLMAIAAFLAVVGGIIFGVSRYEKSNAQEDSIEQVITPRPTPPPEEPAAPIAAISEVLPPVPEELAQTPEVVAILTETSEPRNEIAEVTLPPAIQDPKRSEFEIAIWENAFDADCTENIGETEKIRVSVST